MKQLNKLDKALSGCFTVFTLLVVLSSILFKAMYHYDDYPYFDNNNAMDAIIILLYGVYFIFIIKFAGTINHRINCKYIAMLYLVLAFTYIIFIPLIPFSDMQYVSEGSLKLASFDFDGFSQIEYFKTFKGNIKTCIFYTIPLIFLPKNIFTMKVINILLLLFIAYLIKRITEELKLPYSKLIFFSVLSFLPVFLFINNIYFELFFISLLLLTVLFYLKGLSKIVYAIIFLSLAYFLRKNGLILLISLCIDFFIRYKNKFSMQKRFSMILVFTTLIIGINVFMNTMTSHYLYDKQAPSYPKWNQYYIGLNEEKFGFMDQSFSYNRSLDDVLNRIYEYGPVKLTNILIKKTIWAWTEGTYQSGRYAFGLNTNNGNEKFYYATPLEKYIMNDTQLTRRVITSFCRVQYLFYLFLMCYSTIRNKNYDSYRIGKLIFLGTIAALMFYELKSRYIIHCFPFMIIFAFSGINSLKTDYRKLISKIKKLSI